MKFELRYGDGDSVSIDLPPEVVMDYSSPRGQPLVDPCSAVKAALRDPLEFPPLRQATVAGDRIALAVDRGHAQLPAVIAGVVETLLEGQIEPRNISVVLAAQEDLTRQPLSLLAPAIQDAIDLSVHDPSDHTGMTYLAASRNDKPIYFNRKIGDADVVIPVGVQRLDRSWAYFGVHGSLFPTFSDRSTQERFRLAREDWRARQRQGRREADEAAWLLGVQFTVQVAPGPGDTILHVLAGDARAVAMRGQQICEAAWLHRAQHRASLVVASIEGGEPNQTWENVTRALLVAADAVTDGGSIVLCTKLRQPPGSSIQRLAATRDGDDLLRSLQGDQSSDAFTARLLAQTLDRANVFLLSALEEELVEDLGLGHVSDAGEVTRLSRQHHSCMLVGNAHHAQVATDER